MTADDGAMRAHVRERGLAADMGPGRSLAVLMLEQNAAEGIHRIERVHQLVSRGDVKALVLTHAHFDHLGFAERARSELGIPVYVHENDVPLTRHTSRIATP